MEAIIKSGCPKTANLASAAISLALVFGGAAAYADGVAGFAATALTDLLGDISQSDLEQLDRALNTDATTAQLADRSTVATVANRPQTFRDAAASNDSDLFPHSGRLLPLLVVRPEAEGVVAVQAAAPIRPGMAQPVGVSRSRLRSLAQGGRSVP